MQEKRIKSVVPVYAVGVVWLLYALFLPLYKLWHILVLLALAALVFGVFSKLFPGKVIQVETPQKKKTEPESTGDPELDEIIAQGQLAMREMGRLYASIPDAGVKSRIMEIINISEKIVNDARTDRKDIPRIRKFLNYYLPTTIKLLHAYDRMGSQGIEGENISGTMTRIEDMLDTVVVSYKKQLDALFADEALDIETDITVMEGMLRREGLTDKDF